MEDQATNPVIFHSTMSRHPVLDRLLTANAEWAHKLTRDDPDFFETSAQGQQPQVSSGYLGEFLHQASITTASRLFG